MNCRNTTTRRQWPTSTMASEGSLRVLLIDSDGEWLRSAQDELQMAGLHVDTECSPEEGIALACAGSHDMVIISDFMPDIGHLILLDRLKNSPALRETPIFVLATQDTIRCYDLAIQHRADGYAPRPTRTRKLAGVLKSALDPYHSRWDWIRKGQGSTAFGAVECAG
jgi:CheY-like chemotaxis protein